MRFCGTVLPRAILSGFIAQPPEADGFSSRERLIKSYFAAQLLIVQHQAHDVISNLFSLVFSLSDQVGGFQLQECDRKSIPLHIATAQYILNQSDGVQGNVVRPLPRLGIVLPLGRSVLTARLIASISDDWSIACWVRISRHSIELSRHGNASAGADHKSDFSRQQASSVLAQPFDTANPAPIGRTNNGQVCQGIFHVIEFQSSLRHLVVAIAQLLFIVSPLLLVTEHGMGAAANIGGHGDGMVILSGGPFTQGELVLTHGGGVVTLQVG